MLSLRNLIHLTAAASILMAASSCSTNNQKNGSHKNVSSATSGTTVMMCDESFQRIMEQEVDVFEHNYPKATVLTRYIPQEQCIDSLICNGSTKLCVTARDLTSSERRTLEALNLNPRTQMIAVDAIAIITNPENPVTALTTTDLALILSGELSDWKWVEPGNESGEIKIIFDYNGSSTVSYMTDSLLNGKPFGKNVYAQNSNKGVVEAVNKFKGALGIIGVSWVASDMSGVDLTTEELTAASQSSDTTQIQFDSNVKVLALSAPGQITAVKPYQAYIFDGSYPLHRPIYMTAIGYNNTPAGGFFSFVTGPNGQKLLQMTGVLPAAVAPRIVQVN